MEVVNALAIKILNHLLQNENWALARLAGHAGAVMKIESGILTLLLGIDEHGLFRRVDRVTEADVSVNLPSDVPARLLLDRDSLFSSVKLGGSADVAESFAFVLRNLRWDIEADLATVFGDIVAHRVTRIGKSLAVALQESLSRGTQNLAEYMAQESALVATQDQVREFSSGVIKLRDDVARLEKRISRL